MCRKREADARADVSIFQRESKSIMGRNTIIATKNTKRSANIQGLFTNNADIETRGSRGSIICFKVR